MEEYCQWIYWILKKAIRVDISPIQLGIFPENLFSTKSTRPKNAQFCSDTGISLKKLLLYKCNALRANKEPTEVGSLPNRLLSLRFKWVRDGQYIKQLESFPNNELFDGSKTSNLLPPLTFLHKKEEIRLGNGLLAILNSITFYDKLGNWPVKQLELRSMWVLFWWTSDKSPNIWLSERCRTCGICETHFYNQLGVEIERGLLRNNGLTFPLIKNEYMYTKLGIVVSYSKHKNRKQS